MHVLGNLGKRVHAYIKTIPWLDNAMRDYLQAEPVQDEVSKVCGLSWHQLLTRQSCHR